jgi:hypothetical protein
MSGQHASAYAVRQLPKFDVTLMEQFLDDQRVLKHEVYELFRQHPDLLVAEEEGLTKEEHRELVRRCLRTIINAGYSPMSFFAKDYASYFKLAELLSLVDLSLTIKLGVQYSLWGGSVFNLGTEKHRRKYLEDIDRLRLPGCFAMTELKHGSNVAGLQTEAILDVRTDEWVVNTPDDGAIKWWIGNAAEDGKAATVFARLKVPSPDGSGALDDHGVHAFVVPLRDEQGQLCGGVEIHDCGYKVGLNGIDNGAIRFTNVRVPRDNLLDRFATGGSAAMLPVERSSRRSGSSAYRCWVLVRVSKTPKLQVSASCTHHPPAHPLCACSGPQRALLQPHRLVRQAVCSNHWGADGRACGPHRRFSGSAEGCADHRGAVQRAAAAVWAARCAGGCSAGLPQPAGQADAHAGHLLCPQLCQEQAGGQVLRDEAHQG